MTPHPPPVYLPGHGALLPDGTHVPEAAIARAVEVIAAACALLEALPPQVRVVLEAEAAAEGGAS